MKLNIPNPFIILIFLLITMSFSTSTFSELKINEIENLLSPINQNEKFFDYWYWTHINIINGKEIKINFRNDEIHKSVDIFLKKRDDNVSRYDWTKSFNIVFHIEGISEGAKTPENIEEMIRYIISIIKQNDVGKIILSSSTNIKQKILFKNNWIANRILSEIFFVNISFQLPFLIITLLLVLLFFLLKLKVTLKIFNLKKFQLMLLILTIIFAGMIRFFTTSNLVRTGDHGYESNSIAMESPVKSNPYGTGFFNFFGFIYQFLPKEDIYIFGINKILGTLSVLLIFAFSYMLFDSFKISLFSALLFAFLPVHIRHSASESMFILQIFFALSTLCGFLLFLKTNSYAYYFMSILLLNYTIQIRPDWAIFPAVIFFLFIILDHKILKKLKNPLMWLGIILFLILSHSHLIYMAERFTARDSTSGGIKLNIKHLIFILKIFFSRKNIFFDYKYTPPCYPIFFILGFMSLLKVKWKELIFLFLSLSIFSFIYLSTNAGTFSDRLVFQNSYQMFFILIAGSSLFILDKLKSFYLKNALLVLFVLLTLISPKFYKNFLIEKHNPQNEYSFLKENIPSLKKNCNFVKIEDDDGPGNFGIPTGFPWYMIDKKNYNNFSISELKSYRDYVLKRDCVIYYRALSCYRFANFEPRNNKIRPECKYVEDNFYLIPIAEKSFKNKPYFDYYIPSKIIKIGFYYLNDPRKQ